MFSLSLGMPIIYTCMSQESWASEDYGIRDLVQELELHSGGRHWPRWELEQYRVRSHTLSDPQGTWWRGRTWKAVELYLYSFAAKDLVGGLRLPMVSRVSGVSGEGPARHRLEESEDPLEPTGICISDTSSNPADFHSENEMLLHFCFQISCESLLC